MDLVQGKEALVLLHPKGLRNRFPYLRFSFQELSQTCQDSAKTQLKRRLIAFGMEMNPKESKFWCSILAT